MSGHHHTPRLPVYALDKDRPESHVRTGTTPDAENGEEYRRKIAEAAARHAPEFQRFSRRYGEFIAAIAASS